MLTAGVRRWTLCILEQCTGGGDQMSSTRTREGAYSFLSVFSLCFTSESALVYKTPHVWETLWYVTDMNIISPLPSHPMQFSLSSLCGYAKRYPHSAIPEPHTAIVVDIMTIVNTFQTGTSLWRVTWQPFYLAAFVRVCAYSQWRQIIILLYASDMTFLYYS